MLSAIRKSGGDPRSRPVRRLKIMPTASSRDGPQPGFGKALVISVWKRRYQALTSWRSATTSSASGEDEERTAEENGLKVASLPSTCPTAVSRSARKL